MAFVLHRQGLAAAVSRRLLGSTLGSTQACGAGDIRMWESLPTLRRAVDIPMWERLPNIQNADIAVAGSFFHTTPGVLFAGFPEVS